MSTEPRVASAVVGEAASFPTVLAHTPETTGKFFDLYAEFWQRGVAPLTVREMTRMRNARVTDCAF